MPHRLARPLAAALAALALAACPEAEGGPCRLDSDCEGGLVCAFDGLCQRFAAVQASFDTVQPVDVTSFDTTPADTAGAPDASGCAPVANVFAAGAAPCPAAAEVRAVSGLVIAEEGNGLARLAAVANQVLANGFDQGDIAMALHLDGTLAPGCAVDFAWVRTPDDLAADCTPRFGKDRMPLDIPGLVSTSVDFATLDPETHVLTGLVDKQKLLARLDESIRAVADSLIDEDVDTDGDQVPDKSSAIIQVLFAAP